ncbi:hypothetical protein PVAG01_06028 [Phlyctema vagabunda]|uniref:Uncharacterized protein n=1 Tax=Phlyctema vagabunda TaxID=108571 RepID=A0ABR4PEW7_9HELO
MSSTTSTPTSRKSKAGSGVSKAGSSSLSARGGTPKYTARQQDAQARNKDPWDEYSSDSSDESPYTRAHSHTDSYEMIQRRREAAIILDSPELLMMSAQARGDSIPATRLFFMKQLCGYEDKPKEKPEERGTVPKAAKK